MNSPKNKALTITLPSSLLNGLGKGVDVTPINSNLAKRLIEINGNYQRMYVGNIQDASLEHHIIDFAKMFPLIQIVRREPSFIDEEFINNACIEMIYIDYQNDSQFIITPK